MQISESMKDNRLCLLIRCEESTDIGGHASLRKRLIGDSRSYGYDYEKSVWMIGVRGIIWKTDSSLRGILEDEICYLRTWGEGHRLRRKAITTRVIRSVLRSLS